MGFSRSVTVIKVGGGERRGEDDEEDTKDGRNWEKEKRTGTGRFEKDDSDEPSEIFAIREFPSLPLPLFLFPSSFIRTSPLPILSLDGARSRNFKLSVQLLTSWPEKREAEWKWEWNGRRELHVESWETKRGRYGRCSSRNSVWGLLVASANFHNHPKELARYKSMTSSTWRRGGDGRG